jgi:hypothetical protein
MFEILGIAINTIGRIIRKSSVAGVVRSIARTGEVGSTRDRVCDVVMPVDRMRDLVLAGATRATFERANLIDGAVVSRQYQLAGVDQR